MGADYSTEDEQEFNDAEDIDSKLAEGVEDVVIFLLRFSSCGFVLATLASATRPRLVSVLCHVCAYRRS